MPDTAVEPQPAREAVEAYRGTLDPVMLDTVQEVLRSITGIGPRRFPGGGFQWREPEVRVSEAGLGLCWQKRRRGLALWFEPGNTDTAQVVYGGDEGTHWGQRTGLGMAADECVQWLSDGRD